MHICLITPSFPPLVDGGVAIATGRLAMQLQHRGHRVTVVTSALSATSRPLSRDNLQVYDGVVEDPLQDASAVAELCAWAQQQHRQCPFDVILAYFVYPAGYLAVLVGEALHVPVVCSCRGNDISKAMFIDPATIALVLQRSAHLLFVSDSLRRMADTLVPSRHKATVVANGVDSDLFTPAPSTHSASLVLGTSGILRWKKGIDVFFPLIRNLCAVLPLRVLIAGYGLDDSVEQQIARFLSQHHLEAQVAMTGPLLHEQMPSALQRMTLYVSTSYQEGMPNGVLEAMACALPVVATDADALPELVEHGITGYVCPMGDLDALVNACQQLLTSVSLRQRFGQAGRQRVQQLFTPEREAQTVERVLRAVSASPTWMSVS